MLTNTSKLFKQHINNQSSQIGIDVFKRYFSLMLLISLGMTNLPASASVVRVDFQSEVRWVRGPLASTINQSEPVTGWFTYDTAAPDEDPADTNYSAFHSGEVSVSIGGITYTSEEPEYIRQYYHSGDVEFSLFRIIAGKNYSGSPLVKNGHAGNGDAFSLYFYTSNFFTSSDALPDTTELSHLSSIATYNDAWLIDHDGGAWYTPFSEIDFESVPHPNFSITTLNDDPSPVPEPASTFLFAIGLLGLALTRGIKTYSHSHLVS